MNINLSDIIRDVLLSEFTDESHGGAGDPVIVEEKLEDKKVRLAWSRLGASIHHCHCHSNCRSRLRRR